MSDVSENDERCRIDGCDGKPRWRWWNGMGAFAGYCDEHARDQLDEQDRCPITRAEDVSDGYVLPAGIQPRDSSFPTIRTQRAFDTYLETGGEKPRQCDVAWCSKTRDQCGHDGDAKLRADGGQMEDGYAGWVCDGCGKHVTGSMPVDQCSDCRGRWFEATPERLACDQCGHQDASRVFNSEHNRLCQDCISEENISMYGDRLADAAGVMRGEADELAARDNVDDHLNDVIEGLRHHAEEIEEFLQEEYYR